MKVQVKKIPGKPGYYASNKGGIYSKKKSGVFYKLSPCPCNKYGHLCVNLSLGSRKKSKRCLVHRLVLEAWIGPCPPGMECRHYPDQNPANNNLENISWSTPRINALDKRENGTSAPVRRLRRGEGHHFAKLTVSDVLKIRSLKGVLSESKTADLFGISKSAVNFIRSGRTWKHVRSE